MDNNLIISIIAMLGSFFGVICGVLNHKRCRSRCLTDKEMIVSLDVEDTTPTKDKLKITLPKIPESPLSEEENSVKVKAEIT
jgi:hypothetical protein